MRLVYGFGINDANYAVSLRINGKRVWCPYYCTWKSMLERCYSELYLQKRPTYKGSKVCHKWKYFSNFKLWMEAQDWQGKQLDKDLLGNGKFYSSETCNFVPSWLNNLFIDRGRARGKWPLGVSYHLRLKKFQSNVNIDAKQKYLGYFDTLEEASEVYCKAKLQYVQNKMKNYPDQRIKEAVLKKVETLYGEK